MLNWCDGAHTSTASLKNLPPHLAIVMHISMQQRCTLCIDVQGIPTIPSTLQEELDTNPFLRPDDPAIRKNLRKLHAKCHRRSDHACYDKLLFECSGYPVTDAVTYNIVTDAVTYNIVTLIHCMSWCHVQWFSNAMLRDTK